MVAVFVCMKIVTIAVLVGVRRARGVVVMSLVLAVLVLGLMLVTGVAVLVMMAEVVLVLIVKAVLLGRGCWYGGW